MNDVNEANDANGDAALNGESCILGLLFVYYVIVVSPTRDVRDRYEIRCLNQLSISCIYCFSIHPIKPHKYLI